MKVGFLGFGSMGAAMVPNLVAAGHRVQVWNRHVDASRAPEGVTVLASPGEIFRNEVVPTMLANDDAVRSVVIDSKTAVRRARSEDVAARRRPEARQHREDRRQSDDHARHRGDGRGVVLPSAEIVRDNMHVAIDQGMGAKDWSIVAKIARRRAGLSDDVA